jgi:hypothetical protein
MGDFFGGLRSGIQFPQVVMNQGPLPGSGGLPQPLHETPDARINYGSSLLGNLTPYAYGEPGYLSSQNAYLNIPHKIQKIVPVVYLPEAKHPARDVVDISHPIDDGDIAFVVRLNRNSMFCTGLKNTSMRRAGLGTAIDPFINLCTLNYILSGMQLGIRGNDTSNLWLELLENMDRARFGRQGGGGRDYDADPINLNDVVHVVRHCIRPFGVTRGSERQGGQDESTLSPATWPVSFVVSLTIDGKESNVLNIWHYHDLSAGEDLVLRLKLMPIRQYTLNHYYKGVKRQAWDKRALPENMRDRTHVWQLVPDLLTLEAVSDDERKELLAAIATLPPELQRTRLLSDPTFYALDWREMGFWHIGRSQLMTSKYGREAYWHDDMANTLRTNHLDVTFQPVFQRLPVSVEAPARFKVRELQAAAEPPRPRWRPMLGLEMLKGGPAGRRSVAMPARPAPPEPKPEPPPADDKEPDWLGKLEFSDDALPGRPEPAGTLAEQNGVVPEPDWLGQAEGEAASAPAAGPPLKKANTGRGGQSKRSKAIGGSLLRADGTSEPSMVGII